MDRFCQVILSEATRAFDRPFTYRIPEALRRQTDIGSLVEVPFGSGNRLAQAYVVAVVEPEETTFDVKPVQRVLSARPVLLPDQILLAEKMRFRWLCSTADALRCMVPSAVSAVGDRSLRFAALVDPEEASSRLLDGEINRLGQYRVIELLLECSQAPVQEIMSACQVSRSVLSTLAKNGWIHFFRQVVARDNLSDEPVEHQDAFNPNLDQAAAIHQIIQTLDADESGRSPDSPAEYLLHGVTGSGKTEVYLQTAQAAIDRGRGVIILVPEIALTPQMIQRIQSRFGSSIAVLHSRLTPSQRYEQWQRILREDVRLVVGARSAVFAPLRQIGLIIVDEEQESSYKSETHPRYHAREVARMRAKAHGAVLLMGSATPSIETYVRSEQGTSKRLTLPDRISPSGLAHTQIVDMRQELADGNRSIFSRKLQEELRTAFSRGQQAMILINRRGFSGFVLCRNCGEIIRCPSCSVSMTVHTQASPDRPDARSNRLICHYCGRIKPLPEHCPVCGSQHIGRFGAGTQQVEAAFNQLFAPARAIRMDQDTTVGRLAHARILSQFERHEADVLIGTQMIAKGHDFPNVTVVGILSADLMLGLSDFRASERAFQLITQAAGRSGRGEKAGEVIIQAYNIDDYAIRFAAAQDFQGFFRQEIGYRQRMQYPPFGTICVITFTSMSDQMARESSLKGASACRARKEESDSYSEIDIMEPGPAPIRRIRNRYRHRLVLKGPDPELLAAFLVPIVDRVDFGKTSVAIDFDPYQML